MYNEVRNFLQSEDTWEISVGNACQHSYTALWSILLCLEMPEDALRAAEQGRAQALMDLMKLQYGSQSPAPETLESKATTADILDEIPTQTVFIALEDNTIHLWVLKGADVSFERKSIADVTSLMKNAFKLVLVSMVNARILPWMTKQAMHCSMKKRILQITLRASCSIPKLAQLHIFSKVMN